MRARCLSASLLTLAVLVTLVLRIRLNMAANGYGVGDALWAQLRYFTIWTNGMIGVATLAVALGLRVPQTIPAALLLAIAAVGLVYHTLLGGVHQGLDWWVDHMLHTVIPLGFAAHWLALEPKDRIGWRDLPVWLAWPGVYCGYALLRGAVEGRYPYFFLDPGKQGLTGIALWILALLAAFALGGALIVLTARAMVRRG